MDTRQTKELSHLRGFTLLEVMIALMILASAASIMIGLQTAAVSRTLRDKQVQHAMLASRAIMSAIELGGEEIPISDQNGTPLLAVLQQLGLPAPSSEEQQRVLESLRVFLQIQPWNLPFENISENPMRKLVLGIAWGDAPQERFVVEYLIPAPEPEEPG